VDADTAPTDTTKKQIKLKSKLGIIIEAYFINTTLMKTKFLFIVLASLLLFSCSSVQVRTDYDTQVNFNNYQTFAFDKHSVDHLKINDLDKKRILKAVEQTLLAKGYQKSNSPHLLVALEVDAQRNIRTYPNNGGMVWGGYWMNNGIMNSYEVIEGILTINLLDFKTKALLWQGIGQAPLVDGPEAKTERIQEMVSGILEKYPPKK